MYLHVIAYSVLGTLVVIAISANVYERWFNPLRITKEDVEIEKHPPFYPKKFITKGWCVKKPSDKDPYLETLMKMDSPVLLPFEVTNPRIDRAFVLCEISDNAKVIRSNHCISNSYVEGLVCGKASECTFIIRTFSSQELFIESAKERNRFYVSKSVIADNTEMPYN